MAFPIAYIVASSACVALLAFYVGHVLRSLARGVLFALMLTVLYGVLYVLLQSEDYALLLETDMVRISHYPGSLTVDFVERYDSVDKRYVPTAHGVSL